jgi:Protein-L-isoaspartate(D-aspartate) O-methyltransferase (PCMT)
MRALAAARAKRQAVKIKIYFRKTLRSFHTAKTHCRSANDSLMTHVMASQKCTAIMACLVGPSGKVTGIELDASVAARAKENPSSYPNVLIVNGDGTSVPFDAADVIYINAGVTRPVVSWLERLTDRGLLILPMTANQGFMADDPTTQQAEPCFRGWERS